MANTFPTPFPGAILEVNYDAFFRKIQENIRQSRRLLDQPPLVPNEQIRVGSEFLPENLSPPTIVVVPSGYRYQATRHERQSFVPHLLWSAWLKLDVHCWGYEDPDQLSPLYSFSSADELARQFLVALQAVNGGVPRVAIDGADYVQNVDMNRLGRKLVLHVAIETYIAEDPPVQAPWATKTTPGIVTSVDGQLTNPSSTSTQAIFVVP